ncbi:MAG: hypothetical protein ABR552_04040, partial [Actinomycetota bacterium]
SYSAGARDCLAPTEAKQTPNGNPDDVTGSYMAAGSVSVPGRNLPVGVLTYHFNLPQLNTYTTAGLSISYVAENAIVAVRFRTGSGDASNGLVAIDGPQVAVSPGVQNAGARGTASLEWSLMSANAPSGDVSIVIIPTSWARSDLDPTKPVARVQLCDAALRVSTFAKQQWGNADAAMRQEVSFNNNGVLQQIDPAVSRMRATFKNGAFADAGLEQESLTFAVQVPKNSTMNAAAVHHVRSPLGGPGSLAAVKGSNGASNVLPSSWQSNDPGYGVTSLACAENAADPVAASVCKAWDAARAANETLAQLGPDLSVNGRFDGALAIDRAAIARAGGTLLYDATGADDQGLMDATGRWASSRTFTVSNFYDEAGAAAPSLLDAVVSVTKDQNGLPVLNVRALDSMSVTHLITGRLA